jgi:hypothetical protein
MSVSIQVFKKLAHPRIVWVTPISCGEVQDGISDPIQQNTGPELRSSNGGFLHVAVNIRYCLYLSIDRTPGIRASPGLKL